MRAQSTERTAIGPVSNGAVEYIEASIPYLVDVEVTGTADILFHGWNCEEIAEKGKRPKGSTERKTDNIESYVYRNSEGEIGIPGSYLRGSIVNAAKFRQDPRSPRKSAGDLFKAGVLPMTILASLGTKNWDYEDKSRVQVQRAGVTRIRPAFKAGWKARFELQVILPEYIPPDVLHEVLVNAGRLVGLGDNRPTYGRFHLTKFETLKLA